MSLYLLVHWLVNILRVYLQFCSLLELKYQLFSVSSHPDKHKLAHFLQKFCQRWVLPLFSYLYFVDISTLNHQPKQETVWNFAFPGTMLLGGDNDCWADLPCSPASSLASIQSLLTCAASCCTRKEDKSSIFSYPWLFLHALCEDPHISPCPLHHYSRQLCKSLYCTYSTWRKAILLRDDNISSSTITGHCFEVSEKSYWRASLLPIFSLYVWTTKCP